VVRRPSHRKRNQAVMNDELSSSIPGKRESENARGEGTIAASGICCTQSDWRRASKSLIVPQSYSAASVRALASFLASTGARNCPV
jgi:hypothetical protein